MKKKIEITYTTDDISPAYSKAIRAARNRRELVEAIEPYREVAADALSVANKMTMEDFDDWCKDVKKANRKMPVDWTKNFICRFGTLIMPEKMLIVSLHAEQLKAPWGAVFMRCKDLNWPMIKK